MIYIASLLVLVLGSLACLLWRAGVTMRRDADEHIVTSLDELAPDALVVILGCPTRNRNGTRNRLFDARVASAAAAYHHHAARSQPAELRRPPQSRVAAEASPALTLLCSGWDASGEATEMCDALIRARVAPEAIELDGRSARTIDSVLLVARTRPDRPVAFVSQRFHLTRALHLARSLGLEATGLPAAGGLRGLRPRLREALAVPRARFDAIRYRRSRSEPPSRWT